MTIPKQRKKPSILLSIAALTALLLLAAWPVRASSQINFRELYTAAGEDVYLLNPAGGILSSSALSGNTLLTVTLDDPEGGDSSLVLYDLSAGKKTAELQLSTNAGVTAGLLPDGRVYSVDNMTMEAYIYDNSLRVVSHFAGSGEYQYSSPLMADDGSMLWCVDYTDNSVIGFSMENGAVTRHECGFGKSLYFSGFTSFKGGVLEYLLSGNNGALYLHSLHLEDMTTSLHPLPQGYSYLSGSLLYAVAGEEALFTHLGGADIVYKMNALGENEYPAASLGSLLVIQDTVDQALRLYDLDSNVYKGMFMPPVKTEGLYCQRVMISGDGFAIVTLINGESDASTLYLWDYAAKSHTDSAGITSQSEAEICLDIEARARSIAQKYDIGVLVYGDGTAFSDDIYKGEAVYSDPHTLRALDSLDGFLSKLPDGMLQEMSVHPITRINLYLCGQIKRKSDEGILSAAAFTSTQGNERYVVVNLYEGVDLARNLAHEFMHVMEDRLYSAGKEKSLDMTGYWLTLTPDGKGSAYAYSYKDARGNELTDTKHTGYDIEAENPDSVWFYDPYSKSFPIEDRARIFEYLFASWDELPGSFAGVHMAEKAQYLCAMVRECFPSAYDADTLWWERLITPVSFEDYRTRVEAYAEVPVG